MLRLAGSGRSCCLLRALPTLRCLATGLPPSPPPGGEAALSRAARLLASRLRSTRALEEKLLESEHAEPAVAYALARCLELRLLDDAGLALSIASHKWRTSAWAPGRIRQALLQKKLSSEAAETALAELFGPDGEAAPALPGAEEPSRSDQLLLVAARKQWRLSRGAEPAARSRRLSGWLARRGHNWATARDVLAVLTREDEAQS